MKRYLLFMFHDYYPKGGWNDFYGSYETRAEATRTAEYLEKERGKYDVKQIVDSETGMLVTGVLVESDYEDT